MNIQEKYKKEVVPAMKKKFGYKSIMAVPTIKKVVINTGLGRILAVKTSQEQKDALERISSDFSQITGQKPTVCRAKKSIAAFKVRQGMPLGMKVTLRGKRMYDFLTRFVSIVLPRSRDFRGIEQTVIDKRGNLSLGIKEHTIFPEILAENVRQVFGLEAIVETSARTKEEGLELFKLLGFPFKK